MEESSIEAMVDTGAIWDIIDQDFVTQAKLPTRKVFQPIPVYNVNRTHNEARSIHRVVDMIMTYNQHSEHILHAITHLGKQSMMLRFTWLDKHNLEIDFCAQTIKMTRCLPHCIDCQTNHKVEWNIKRKDIEQINTCWTGPFPAFVEDADASEEDESELTPELSPNLKVDFPDEPLEEGDQIWMTGLFHQPEHIHMTAIVFQWLAEGFLTELSTCRS